MGTTKCFEHVPPRHAKGSTECRFLGCKRAPILLFAAAVGSQDRHNWFWQVRGNGTGSENLHAYMTCKCRTGFWPYVALAWRGDLGIVTFLFSVGIQIGLRVGLTPGYEVLLLPLGTPGWGLCLWTSSSKQSGLKRRAGIPISIGDSQYLSMEPTCSSCSGVGRSSIRIPDTDGVKHFRANGNLKKNVEDDSFEFVVSCWWNFSFDLVWSKSVVCP